MHAAIREYLQREEQLAQFRDEMQAAWEDYQETGLHVTGKEVFAWMETWFTPSPNSNTPVPSHPKNTTPLPDKCAVTAKPFPRSVTPPPQKVWRRYP
jgi:hypothetical protein